MSHKSLTVLILASLALASCSGGAAKPAATVPDGPAYVAATRIWDDTTTTSFFHVLPSLAGGTPVDASQALEVAGAAKLFAFGDLGWFAIGGGEAPTITRYTLDDHGSLAKGKSISLGDYGVTDLWDTLYFVSDDKAYYPDTDQSQLIVWNPTTMTVTGSIALPQTIRDGYLSYYGLTALRRGADLIFSVGWFDWLESDKVVAETGLVVIDTGTDKVKRYDVDTRCGGITQAIEVSSGDAYLVSSALAGAAYRVGRLASKPCALRLPRGADALDPAYAVQLESLVSGAIAGEPAPANGDELFLRVLDAGLVEVKDDSHTWDLTGQSAWRWARWNVATNELRMVQDLPASTADVFWFRVDGKVYASETKSDYSETTLIDLLAPEGERRAITVPGFLQNVARIR
jgi:hypothetical protein